MHKSQEPYTAFQDASRLVTGIDLAHAQTLTFLAHLTCALHSLRLVDCRLLFPCTFLFPSSLSLSCSSPEASSRAFSLNLSSSELNSQPLPVFHVSISHLHHACLTFSRCLPGMRFFTKLFLFLSHYRNMRGAARGGHILLGSLECCLALLCSLCLLVCFPSPAYLDMSLPRAHPEDKT